MKEYFFDIGGVTVALSCPEQAVEITGSLSQFQLPCGPCRHRIQLSFAEALPAAEGTAVFESPERRVFAKDGGYQTYIGPPERPWLWIHRQGDQSQVLALEPYLQ